MVPMEGPLSLDGKVFPGIDVTLLIQTGQPKRLSIFPIPFQDKQGCCPDLQLYISFQQICNFPFETIELN